MDNPVARAIKKVGGPLEASFICRVSTNMLHIWRRRGVIKDARVAVLLSKASGIPVSELAGVQEDKMSATYQARSLAPRPNPETPAAA